MHYSVLVIGENPLEQLAPFQEENEEFMEFSTECTNNEMVTEFEGNDNYDDFDEYVEDCGYVQEGDNWGFMTNPNGKWDWYQLGGRWKNSFALKDGADGLSGEGSMISPIESKKGYVDSALKGDIDFFKMMEEEMELAKKHWMQAKTADVNKRNWKYGIGKDTTIEEYISPKDFSAYAVLYNGEWMEEVNTMEIIEGLSDDTRLSVYDIHS